MRGDNYIHCNDAAINRSTVLAALAQSNLHWEMHQAQVYALECQVLQEGFTEGFTELTGEISEDLSREIFSRPKTQVTLMGLPVFIDNANYPKSLVRLMSGDKELSRLECLSNTRCVHR